MAGEKENKGKRDEPSSEFDNFQNLLKRVLSAPKGKIDERRAEHEQEKARNRGRS